MNITLFQQSNPYNSLIRNMTGGVSVIGHLRDGCSIISPEIELSYDASIVGKNYAFIPDFGRYYYYTQAPTINGKTMILHLHADSVYNYRNIISVSQCVAERSSSRYDLMLPDSAVQATEGYIYYSRVLPYTFKPEHGQYVLTISGGV